MEDKPQPLTNQEEDENFIEGSEYSSKSEFSKPSKVAEALSRCLELRAKPMEPGFENTAQSNDGSITKTKIPDARQAYISSVIALKNLLYPECLRDTEYKKFEDSNNKKINDLFNLYAYEEYEIISIKEGRAVLKKNGKKFIPEIDAILSTDVYDSSKRTLIRTKGYWNSNVNAYWDACVGLYDNIFSELNLVIDRLNYFKSRPSY